MGDIDINNTEISYFELLKMIKSKSIDKDKYIYIDNKHKTWVWSDDISGFQDFNLDKNIWDTDYKTNLTDEYDELEMVDLKFTLMSREKEEDTPKYIAAQQIIKNIEDEYMDLSMAVDDSQGCMSDLEVAFAKLKLYSDVVKFLGGNIENHLEELTNQWYIKIKQQQQEIENENKTKDEIIKKLSFPVLDLMTIEQTTRDILWKQNDKINEICDILRAEHNK